VALLQVMLRLSYPDIIMQPNAADIKKALARLALRIMESSKPFVRWMDGTCLEAQPIHGQSSLCHLPCSFVHQCDPYMPAPFTGTLCKHRWFLTGESKPLGMVWA
jgi:hypothetical protein